jgi:dTDP-4-dehydrorhamnose reductase
MIWVVGANGMLGQDVVRKLDVVGLHHLDSDLDCDITNSIAVKGFADGRGIKWIINCSAYTAVDKAEEEEAKADMVNATGPLNLGRCAAEIGARVIHISTDYVFDGKASLPYTEDHRPAPQGSYGRTKARGEILLAKATPSHFVVRTAWLYGARGKNFVYAMLRLMNERDDIAIVDDQYGSPTYTADLASALCVIVEKDSRSYGIYHYTNEGETTWFEFARSIFEMGKARGRIGRWCNVRPISTDQYPTKATRPKYSVLSKEKIKQTLGISIPTWQNALERFFAELEGVTP